MEETKNKLNNAQQYEKLCNVKLDKEKYPIAYGRRVDELVSLGVAKTREEAEEIVAGEEVELELYYSPNYGLFAVDSTAVEDGATIYDPYSGEVWSEFDEEEY